MRAPLGLRQNSAPVIALTIGLKLKPPAPNPAQESDLWRRCFPLSYALTSPAPHRTDGPKLRHNLIFPDSHNPQYNVYDTGTSPTGTQFQFTTAATSKPSSSLASCRPSHRIWRRETCESLALVVQYLRPLLVSVPSSFVLKCWIETTPSLILFPQLLRTSSMFCGVILSQSLPLSLSPPIPRPFLNFDASFLPGIKIPPNSPVSLKPLTYSSDVQHREGPLERVSRGKLRPNPQQ